jgi:pimeloyl-ACP methyl ester carboxylesterase
MLHSPARRMLSTSAGSGKGWFARAKSVASGAMWTFMGVSGLLGLGTHVAERVEWTRDSINEASPPADPFLAEISTRRVVEAVRASELAAAERDASRAEAGVRSVAPLPSQVIMQFPHLRAAPSGEGASPLLFWENMWTPSLDSLLRLRKEATMAPRSTSSGGSFVKILRLRNGSFVEAWVKGGGAAKTGAAIVVVGSVPETVSQVFEALPADPYHRCIMYRHAAAPLTWPGGRADARALFPVTGKRLGWGRENSSFSSDIIDPFTARKLDGMTVSVHDAKLSTTPQELLDEHATVQEFLKRFPIAQPTDRRALPFMAPVCAEGGVLDYRYTWNATQSMRHTFPSLNWLTLSSLVIKNRAHPSEIPWSPRNASRPTLSARHVHTRPVVSPDTLAEELSAVLEALQVEEEVVLVAANYDWLAALRFAERNSAGVQGVMLLDPLLPWPEGPISKDYPHVFDGDFKNPYLQGGRLYTTKDSPDKEKKPTVSGDIVVTSARARELVNSPRDVPVTPPSGLMMASDDVFRLAELDGARDAAFASVRGRQGDFASGVHSPYAANPLISVGKPSTPEPILPSETDWPHSLVGKQALFEALARVDTSCAVAAIDGVEAGQGILDPGVLFPASTGGSGGVVSAKPLTGMEARKRIEKQGFAAINMFGGGLGLFRGAVDHSAVLSVSTPYNGLHLPLQEMVAAHM